MIVYTLGAQNYAEITVFRTVSEINTFLCLTQKFKTPVKNSGRTIFGKKANDSVHSLWVTETEISAFPR